MTIHQCPKCELRFTWLTELDDHCRADHPEFSHKYPASPPPRVEEEPVHSTPESEATRTLELMSTWWTER